MSNEYIETATGNRVSRQSVLCGTQNIHLHGKTLIERGVVVRGDFANVRIGRHCVIGEGAVVRPAYKRFKGGFSFFPVTIGDHVLIEKDCVIEATAIGSSVWIGKGSVISKRCILKDCCKILEGSVLAPDTVVPPFSVFGGAPARLVEELPEAAPELIREVVKAAAAAARS